MSVPSEAGTLILGSFFPSSSVVTPVNQNGGGFGRPFSLLNDFSNSASGKT